jgi:hypothetical protein
LTPLAFAVGATALDQLARIVVPVVENDDLIITVDEARVYEGIDEQVRVAVPLGAQGDLLRRELGKITVGRVVEAPQP